MGNVQLDSNAHSLFEQADMEASELAAPANCGNHSRNTRPWRQILITSTLIVATLIFASTIYAGFKPSEIPKMPHKPLRRLCGRTPGQAKAANCTFDVMMDEWLPDSCLDRELLEEFKGLKDWSFWADENRTKPISEAQLSESAVAYTTLEYHVAHCSFAVRKFHRAIAANRPVEMAVASVAHTTHCAEMHRKVIESLEKSNDVDGEKYSVLVEVTPLHPGFPVCVDAKNFDMLQ